MFVSMQALPYFLILMVSVIVLLIVTIIALRVQKYSEIKTTFLIFMVAITFWDIFYAFEIAASTFESKYLWTNLQYLGILTAPGAFFAFSLQYSNYGNKLKKFRWMLLFIEPVIMAGFLIFDHQLHIFRRSITMVSDPLPELIIEFGPVFWINIFYTYALMLVSFILIGINFFQTNPAYRRQTGLVLISSIFPWGANIVDLSGMDPIPHLSVTVLSFILSGFTLSWALSKHQLLKIIPLAQSEVIQNMQDGILVLDSDFMLVDINQCAANWLHIEPRKVIGSHLRAINEELYGLVLSKTNSAVFTICEDGKILHFEVHLTNLLDRKKSLSGYVAVLHDVTVRKYAEEALQRSESRYRSIFENQLTGLAVYAPDGQFMQVNDRMTEMFGYSGEEFYTLNFLDVSHPEDMEVSKSQFEKLLNGDLESYSLEKRYIRKDGSIFWSQVYVSGISESGGNIETVASIIIDISRRKEVEKELKESEELFRSVFERANDGVAVLQDEVFKYINPRFARMIGYMEDDLFDQPFIDYFAPEERDTINSRYHQRIAGKKIPTQYETALYHRDQYKVDVEINAGLMEFQGRTADLVIFRDIKERKITERELASKNADLEESVREANHLRQLAEQRAREIETLRQTSLVIGSSLTQSETIQQILDQLAIVVPYDSATVQLLQRDHLEIVGCRGSKKPDEIIGKTFSLDTNQPGVEVIKTLRPVLVKDLLKNFPEYAKLHFDQVESWLGIPVLAHQDPLGILTLNSVESDRFTRDHIEMAEAFANHVAIALENARLFEEVQRLAITDYLTGLYNRRYFYDVCQNEMERFKRYAIPFSFLMLDIDFFKNINDTYGHLAGDQALQSVARHFQNNLRNVDVLCRYGGEEFIALLPATDVSKAGVLAERLREIIADAVFNYDGQNFNITVSIGVCEISQNMRSVDDLLNDVDRALYDAKRAGRNCVKSC